MSKMSNMTSAFSTKVTPQSQPIPGREADMTENSAGGFSFAVDKWTRLNRFLILGSEGGSYYASERKLTAENAKVVLDCVQEDVKRTVDLAAAVSDAGRAPKNTPALFVLALACKMAPTEEGKAYAYAALPKVARIPTHLIEWTEAIKAFGGFTHGFRRAVGRWYLDKDAHTVALHSVKYQNREGWSGADLLRLSKPGSKGGSKGAERGSEHDHIFGWMVGKWAPGAEPTGDATDIIWAFEKAKAIGLENDGKVTKDRTRQVVRLITDYRLPREAIPTNYLNEVEVWDALLDNGGKGMPMEAMVRNLPKMTSIGLLAPMSAATGRVIAALGNADAVKKARLHPLKVLVALNTYKQGHGVLGSLSWNAVSQVVDALDGAFYLSFGAVEPTGKRWLLALDISGSMSGPNLANMPGISPRIGAAAMAMVTARVETQHHIVAFASGGGRSLYGNGGTPGKNHWHAPQSQYRHAWSSTDGLTPVAVSPRQRLDDVVNTIYGLPAGGTDCALPMIYALDQKIPVDVFVVYTDSETWAGNIQPVQALQKYRQKMGIPARLIVVGMVANNFTLADPKDAGMLDVCGFDTTAPSIMSEFAKGNI